MNKSYSAARPVSSDNPEVIAAAVRAATEELRDTLQRHDIALLGHSESWDDEGQRWVQVEWDGVEAG